MALSNTNGVVVERYVYDAYGRTTILGTRFDADADGDVDLADFAKFQVCFSGGGVPPPDECPSGTAAAFDADADGDVDLADYAAFRVVLAASGPGVPLPDAGGSIRLPNSAFGNPFAWTGQRFDAFGGLAGGTGGSGGTGPSLGLYHFYFRTYSPTLGRWLQRDPIGYMDGVNLYEYVLGAPLYWIDAYGLDAEGDPYEEGIEQAERRVESIRQDVNRGAQIARVGLETAARLNPISDVAEAVTGEDIITGEALGAGDRALAVAGLVPGFGFADDANDARKAAKGADALRDAGKGADVARAGEKATDRAADAAKIERHHELPKEFKDLFDEAGINIDDPKYIQMLSKGEHRLKPGGLHTGPDNWNKQWREFFDQWRDDFNNYKDLTRKQKAELKKLIKEQLKKMNGCK